MTRTDRRPSADADDLLSTLGAWASSGWRKLAAAGRRVGEDGDEVVRLLHREIDRWREEPAAGDGADDGGSGATGAGPPRHAADAARRAASRTRAAATDAESLLRHLWHAPGGGLEVRVRACGDDWQVRREWYERAPRTAVTKRRAVDLAEAEARRRAPCRLVVERRDGTVERERWCRAER